MYISISTVFYECGHASFLSLTTPQIPRCYHFLTCCFCGPCFIVQACNAHGIYCVPLYDTLGELSSFPGAMKTSDIFQDFLCL